MMEKLKSNLYYEGEMTEKDYTRSKICITVADIAHGFGANFSGAAYITGLLAYMGASEGLSSLVLSVGVIAPVFQCMAPWLLEKLGYKKPLHFFCHFFRLLFLSNLLIMPLYVKEAPWVPFLIGALYFISSVLVHMPGGAYNSWFMSLAEHGNIYRYMGIRDGITNLCMAGAHFYCAFMASRYTGADERFFYVSLGIPTLIMLAVETFALLYTKEPKTDIPKVEGNIFENIKRVFTSKEMRTYIKFNVIMSLTSNAVSIVWSIFMVQRLGLPLSIISIIYLADMGMRFIFSNIWGRIIGKTGYMRSLVICLSILFIETVLRGFIFVSNMYIMIAVISVVTSIANSGYAISSFNFYYRSIPEGKQATYTSYYNAVMSVFNWGITLVVSAIISLFNKQTVSLIGLEFSEMNLIFLVCSLGYVATAVVVFLEDRKLRSR